MFGSKLPYSSYFESVSFRLLKRLLTFTFLLCSFQGAQIARQLFRLLHNLIKENTQGVPSKLNNVDVRYYCKHIHIACALYSDSHEIRDFGSLRCSV